MPHYARTARFDHQSRRVSCTKGTRTETLDAIYRWFKGGILDTGETLAMEGNPQGRIFWLGGVAGTGKSTIAQTVAHHFHTTSELGASFFCSRDDADCSNLSLLFPTIAYQLSLFHPSFEKHLSDAMAKDPDVQLALVSMQLEKLIVNPLNSVIHESFPPCIVIIDALDECKDENATSTILLALSVFASRLFPIKFFITSRPVANVVRGFRDTDLMQDTNTLVLHSIPWDISQKDIGVYLAERLSRVARSLKLKSWPSSKAFAQLIEKSNGLFIFAATAANFIEDRNASNPKRQLTILLSTKYITSTQTSPHHHLDGLYLTVLHEAFPNISEDQQVSLQMVLGTIVLLYEPLDVQGLEVLLELEESTVHSTLQHLHSIAIIPDAGCGPIRLIHPSFSEFLVDPVRCNDPNFLVHPILRHTSVAECCLQVLQTLSPDICQINGPSIYNQEVTDPDLPVRIVTCIPAHVRYACRHWASHLSNGNINNIMWDLLLSFCSNQLLNWLEVMSLLGELNGAITALHLAYRIVNVSYLIFSSGTTNEHGWL